MINKKMENAVNQQIKNELFSSYLYLSMSAYFETEGWEGMAHWMRTQSNEELKHAMKFYKHITEREGRVELFPLDKPQMEWKSPMDAFKSALEHEKFITKSIYDLLELANEEKDYPAQLLLHWFVEEQVEEESSASKIVADLEKIGDSKGAIYMLDHQLGKRE